MPVSRDPLALGLTTAFNVEIPGESIPGNSWFAGGVPPVLRILTLFKTPKLTFSTWLLKFITVFRPGTGRNYVITHTCPLGKHRRAPYHWKKIHFGSLILIGSTHKFSTIFSIISFRPGLYRILGTITIILLPAILLNKRLPLHPISVDWIYKNMIYFISTTTPSLPALKKP